MITRQTTKKASNVYFLTALGCQNFFLCHVLKYGLPHNLFDREWKVHARGVNYLSIRGFQCNLDKYSLLGRISVGVKIKVHNVFYTHTSIYSKLILSTDVPNTDNFHLTPCTIYRAKTGNTVSEFTHSNWITLSTIQVLNTRVCFLNVWYTSLTLLFTVM